MVARWFNRLGICTGCQRRAATGTLMDEKNSPIGPFCDACAQLKISRDAYQENLAKKASTGG